MTHIFMIIFQALIVPALSPLIIGIIRKIKARMQNRQGASIFQPYRDINKLLHKDEIISSDATFIFRIAPYMVFGATIAIAVSIPIIGTFVPHLGTSDLLAVVYMMAFGTFFLALSGIDIGGPFGGFGASREMAVSALAEGGLVFSLFAIAFIAGTSDLISIPKALLTSGAPVTTLSTILAFFGFCVALLAENMRFPFDNPSTHLELTMVHEAMIIEYSGKRLALMEWASANKLLIFMILGANIFFPYGIAMYIGLSTIIISILVLLAKILVFCAAIAFIESTTAKLRLFRLPDLLFLSIVASMLAIIFICI